MDKPYLLHTFLLTSSFSFSSCEILHKTYMEYRNNQEPNRNNQKPNQIKYYRFQCARYCRFQVAPLFFLMPIQLVLLLLVPPFYSVLFSRYYYHYCLHLIIQQEVYHNTELIPQRIRLKYYVVQYFSTLDFQV